MNQNDLSKEVILHRIGICPVCNKGQMLQGSAGWTCDYFHSLEDKCTFTIFQSYDGYELTEEDAVQLITNGETDIKSFHTLNGKPFTAKLKRIGNKVKVVGANETLSVRCSKCGGKVKEMQKGYSCENFFKEGEEHCGVWIPKEICGRTISIKEAEECLEYGRTEVLDGFKTQQGKEFSSCMVMQENGNFQLDGKICVCPKCGGMVYAGIKGYNCSNYRNMLVKCDFVIWRSIFGRKITVNDVRTLCTSRQTGIMDFKTKDGKLIQRAMLLNDEDKVKLI